MILLRNFDYATKYFDYKSKNEINNISNPKMWGWYKFINGFLSAILILENQLYFVYSDDKFLITDTHKVLLKDTNEVNGEFILMDKNSELVKFLYPLPKEEPAISPFEYIDKEDFKWGNFIRSIVNNLEKRKNFVTNILEIN